MTRLLVLFVTAFVDMVGLTMIIPLLPFYATELGASATVVGLLVSAFAVAQLAVAPVWGRFSDRYGRRPAILAGLLLTGCRLCHLRLRRIGAGTAPLPPGAGAGRRHHRGGAGVRGRCLGPRRADQEPGLALGGDQPGRRGRAGVRVGDDQPGREDGAGARPRPRWRSWSRVSPRAFWSSRTSWRRPGPTPPPPPPARARRSAGYSPTGASRPRGSSGSTPSASGPSTAPSRSCRSCS